MKPETALKHYGSRAALAQAAMVSKQAVAQWFKTGLIPRRTAELLERESKGKLKVRAGLYA